MSNRLPSLCWCLAALLHLLQPASGQTTPVAEAAASPAVEGAAEDVAENSVAAADGNQLLASAAATYAGYRSVTAKLRQKVDLFGKQLSGSGTYTQGPPNANLLRLELRLQSGPHTNTLLQVSDGKEFWTYRQLGESAHTIRVDLARIEQRQQEHSSSPPVGGLGIGGLTQLIRGLAGNFHFAPATANSLGGLPVYVIEGRWKPHAMARVLPHQQAAIEAGESPDLRQLPEHLPDRVLVYLGQKALFPYRIEYRRRAGSGADIRQTPTTAKDRAIVVMEFYEVTVDGPVDPLQFVYHPDTSHIEDHTEEYLQRIGP